MLMAGSIRSLIPALLFALPTAMGCSSSATPQPEVETESTDTAQGAVTDVEQSTVKRQMIGNCWLYATASWIESLHKSVGGEELDVSESYWTYWHWFEQIARSSTSTEIQTGGSWRTAVGLAQRYGVMTEADFIPEEATEILSLRQASARNAINASLSTGALKEASARRDRALVRAELDRAWGLSDTMKASIDRVFGASVDRTLKNLEALPEGVTDVPITTVYALDVRVPDPKKVTNTRMPLPSGSDFVNVKLADLIGIRRNSPYNWNEVYYPSRDAARRSVQTRFQRALHDRQPVIVSWFVDFNYRSPDNSKFIMPDPLPAPGRQGGHMVVMEDYQIDTGAVFGVLAAGATLDPLDPANGPKFEAVLSPDAKLEFIRIKNSWGLRSEPATGFFGYHDLSMSYLNGSVPLSCADETDPDAKARCEANPRLTSTFSSVVLPAGYN
jgi:hypothetical protein